jgi:Flp pilus assembly protein TadG
LCPALGRPHSILVYFTHLTSRLRDDAGQAAVEFVLVLPLLFGVLFAIFQFSAAFNALNDMSQMAADGARLAAVNRFPTTQADLIAWRAAQGDTSIAQNAKIEETGCTIGDPVHIRISTTITIVPVLPLLGGVTKSVEANAEMRREATPSGTCPLSTP